MSIKSRFTAVLSAITGNTEPAPKAPRKGEQTAQLAKARGTIGEHPSKGLTPQKLHQILEGAEDGDITAQSELFADMEEKDGHIFAEMSKRKRALTGLDWRVSAPKNADEAGRQLPDAGVQLGQQSPHTPAGLLGALCSGRTISVVRIEVSQVRVPAPLLHADAALAPGHGLRVEQAGDREEPGQGAVDVVSRPAGSSS